MEMIDKIKRLRKIVNDYGLAVGDKVIFDLTSDIDLALIYNGIGPEWFAPSLREFIDGLHADLEPPAMVHDFDFETADGTTECFRAANARLEANCRIIADRKYGWYNPLRYVRRWQGRKFRQLCDAFGLTAYQAAVAKGLRKETAL